MISFDVTPADRAVINKIADRAVALQRKFRPKRLVRKAIEMQMDIAAVHANGCPLDLDRLLAADDFNFAHDVFGIEEHLDRNDRSKTAGQLLGFFLPRFALKCQDAAPNDPPRVKENHRPQADSL